MENCCNQYFNQFMKEMNAYEDFTGSKRSEMILSKVRLHNLLNVALNYNFQDWSEYSLVIFPGLNIQPDDPPHTFWSMCEKLFKYVKEMPHF